MNRQETLVQTLYSQLKAIDSLYEYLTIKAHTPNIFFFGIIDYGPIMFLLEVAFQGLISNCQRTEHHHNYLIVAPGRYKATIRVDRKEDGSILEFVGHKYVLERVN